MEVKESNKDSRDLDWEIGRRRISVSRQQKELDRENDRAGTKQERERRRKKKKEEERKMMKETCERVREIIKKYK